MEKNKKEILIDQPTKLNLNGEGPGEIRAEEGGEDREEKKVKRRIKTANVEVKY